MLVQMTSQAPISGSSSEPNHMFAKLCVVIIAIGATGCTLLALRQQRLDTVHDMTMAQRRIIQHDKDLARLRVDIATNLEPQRIEAIAGQFADLHNIGLEQSTNRPGGPTGFAGALRPAVASSRTDGSERPE
jgi:hypothetical protein